MMERILLTLPSDWLDAIRAIAKDDGETLAGTIRNLITSDEYIDPETLSVPKRRAPSTKETAK